MKKTIYNLVKLALVALLALPVGSCQKPYEMDLPLAVSRANFTVKKEAGKVFFIVYSQQNWTAEFDAPITWARLSRTSGDNQTQVNVEYDENTDLSRGVNIVVRSGNLTRKVYLSQNAGMSGDIAYNPEQQSISLLKEPYAVEIAARSNVPAANMAIAASSVNYVTEGEEWIQNIVVTDEKVTFDVLENASGAVRQAIVQISFPVAAWDEPITAMIAVTQGAAPAAFGSLPESVAADPNGINQLSIELSPNFAPSLYDYRAEYSISYPADGPQDWLRNADLDAETFKFTAAAKPNPAEMRTATITFTLKDKANNVCDTRVVTVTQEKSNMGATDGGNDNGEEPKDPEEDF